MGNLYFYLPLMPTTYRYFLPFYLKFQRNLQINLKWKECKIRIKILHFKHTAAHAKRSYTETRFFMQFHTVSPIITFGHCKRTWLTEKLFEPLRTENRKKQLPGLFSIYRGNGKFWKLRCMGTPTYFPPFYNGKQCSDFLFASQDDKPF